MQRRSFFKLALAASAVATAGCSRSISGAGASAASTPTTMTTLNFYTDKAAWEPSFKAMDAASAADNMKLQFTGYSDPTAYDSFIKQAFRTKKVPDLFTWHTGAQMQQLVDQGLIAETGDMWAKAETDKLVPAGLKDNYKIGRAHV